MYSTQDKNGASVRAPPKKPSLFASNVWQQTGNGKTKPGTCVLPFVSYHAAQLRIHFLFFIVFVMCRGGWWQNVVVVEEDAKKNVSCHDDTTPVPVRAHNGVPSLGLRIKEPQSFVEEIDSLIIVFTIWNVCLSNGECVVLCLAAPSSRVADRQHDG
mmetsp:Transcript_6724/g.15357  ORF Transcript_6724/g.15357 Transcript_6724/m.15357 type:complete len:157 (-) Transcript_6724:398-868(-)